MAMGGQLPKLLLVLLQGASWTRTAKASEVRARAVQPTHHTAVGVNGVADSPPARSSLDALWGGLDDLPIREWEDVHEAAAAGTLYPLPAQALAFAKRGGANGASTSAAASRTLQIVGMFDAGTNMLGALLEANFGVEKMREICPGSASGDGYHCFWFKHMPPKALDVLLKSEARTHRGLLTIAVVRSPLAHMRSWLKAPYILGRSCLFNMTYDPSVVEKSLASPCLIPFLRGERFEGLPGVWNAFTQVYADHEGEPGFMVVEYERLVLEPEPTIKAIAKSLGIKLHLPVQTIEGAAKVDGLSHGRAQALRQIREEDHLTEGVFAETRLRKKFCDRLDAALLHRFRVPTRPPRPYSKDCEF